MLNSEFLNTLSVLGLKVGNYVNTDKIDNSYLDLSKEYRLITKDLYEDTKEIKLDVLDLLISVINNDVDYEIYLILRKYLYMAKQLLVSQGSFKDVLNKAEFYCSIDGTNLKPSDFCCVEYNIREFGKRVKLNDEVYLLNVDEDIYGNIYQVDLLDSKSKLKIKDIHGFVMDGSNHISVINRNGDIRADRYRIKLIFDLSNRE